MISGGSGVDPLGIDETEPCGEFVRFAKEYKR